MDIWDLPISITVLCFPLQARQCSHPADRLAKEMYLLTSTKVRDYSLRNAEASLHEVPFKLIPKEEARTVLSASLGLFLQYSG